MQAVSIGHAGILVRAGGRTLVCDPWFTPAFFGSWFVFPRNDRLDGALMEQICNPDYLYVSHLHGDHFDADFLATRMNKDVPVILPGFPTREMERTFNRLGFRNFVRTVDGEMHDLGGGLRVAVHLETSITDGPGGDSAIIIEDGTRRILDQNDCRIDDTAALTAHGPIDLHFLQFSGAIWYPMVYEMDADAKARLCREKVESQFSRAMRYVETVDARRVVPSAGPPCFLDDSLFGFNMITGDEPTIFPDQTVFLAMLERAGREGILNIPGTLMDLDGSGFAVAHPLPDDEVAGIFRDKAAYLAEYARDWKPWLDEMKAAWSVAGADPAETLRLWWEPLLAMAPNLRAGVGAACLIRSGDRSILVDFPAGTVREGGGDHAFRFDIEPALLDAVVAERAVDWSNSLFLSCRFTAWRAGDFNEYLYNFFKSLSVERMARAEAEAKEKLGGASDDGTGDVRIGDYLVQRRCPHRNADLGVFGTVDGNEIVCTLHGWRFDAATGKCLTSREKSIRVRRAE